MSKETRGEDAGLLLRFGVGVAGLSMAAHPTRSGTDLYRRAFFINGCRFLGVLVIEGTTLIANRTEIDSEVGNS